MPKKTTIKKSTDEVYNKQLRRNQFIFGIVAVILILSMGLSMVTF